MVAFGVGRVNLVHGSYGARLQVYQIEVGLVMPDVEHAVVAQCEHQVAAVGRYARQCGTLAQGVGPEHQLAGAEGERLGVE